GYESKECLGMLLSALIQTSYQQGFNDFEFEEVNAHFFGTLLEGKEEDKIRIKAKKIGGHSPLCLAKNCFLTAKIIESFWLLDNAQDCVAEITHYQGSFFGMEMKNCKIYSPNQETLNKMREQIRGATNTSFYLTKVD
ncbi:hypothetical protein HY643_04405, partial [Candidatus Woesearchaeota archaeon]|nr:hypothetical protein [Candidatus Woesearchaeota archaeon]